MYRWNFWWWVNQLITYVSEPVKKETTIGTDCIPKLYSLPQSADDAASFYHRDITNTFQTTLYHLHSFLNISSEPALPLTWWLTKRKRHSDRSVDHQIAKLMINNNKLHSTSNRRAMTKYDFSTTIAQVREDYHVLKLISIETGWFTSRLVENWLNSIIATWTDFIATKNKWQVRRRVPLPLDALKNLKAGSI